MQPAKVPFDANTGIDVVRMIVLERLRIDRSWRSFAARDPDGFEPFVEFVGQHEPEIHRVRVRFESLALEVYWQLLAEGVLTPRENGSSLDVRDFVVTQFGREVLTSRSPLPHDPTGYLAELRQRIPDPDPTVIAYLAEALDTFRRGSNVAAAVMLGIAAERVFELLCESLLAALADAKERDSFEKLLSRFSMKPKLERLLDKFREIQKKPPEGFPDNSTTMVLAIYDLIRYQRNELAHPREAPPSLDRRKVFANLQLFAAFYETAEAVRAVLANEKV